MSIQIYRLGLNDPFPPPAQALADPNGLLAYGGDLSVERLLSAYQQGIFPWFSAGEPVLWWSPDPRGVLFLDNYRISRSFNKFLKNSSFQVTINNAFVDVIHACSSVPRQDKGTWITEEMVVAYCKLHEAGHAHSVEVWQENTLVGGLYGVAVGRVFCGESMFHLRSNASKLAFHTLVQYLTAQGCTFLDCQMQTQHLSSVGAEEISRAKFLALLTEEQNRPLAKDAWRPQNLSHVVQTGRIVLTE
ncbi:MAG: leucyl/phenylalanyl-tRNA--protein transferase [Aestuariibacter sp.]